MKIVLHTSLGDIVLRLFDTTPLHRDNFVRLSREGYYNGTLFHRVIRDFMIQGGDPESKGAPAGKMLGTGGPNYTIPAEINTNAQFHRRGALCAARQADEVNPNRESSGSQFYIVWGKTYKLAELKQMERQMRMQQEQSTFNALVSAHRAEIMQMRRNRDHAALQALQEELEKQAKAQCKAQGCTPFTEEQIAAYTTDGGTPFLDGQYTVFGQVEDGLDVVDSIQQCDTLRGDRPKSDVVIISVDVVD